MKLAIALLVVALPAVANAQPTPPHDAGTVWLGGGAGLLTAGTLDRGPIQTVDQGTITGTADLTSPVAVNAVVEDQVTDAIAVGLAPRYVLPFADHAGAHSADASTMLDNRVRVSVGGHLTPSLRVYGLGAVGYAIIFEPADSAGARRATGLTVTIGGGASLAITPRVRAYAELGYEVGREKDSAPQAVGVLHIDYAELGAGIEFAIGR
jgi:hypothetical protein